MGKKGWYVFEDESSYSSYTDFTEFNNNEGRHKAKKQRAGGPGVFCTFGVLAMVMVSALGSWYYLSDKLEDVSPDTEIVVKAGGKIRNESFFSGLENGNVSLRQLNIFSDKSSMKKSNKTSYNKNDPAYQFAESLVQSLKCSNDTETAWEIFNWVHSNITYVPITESQTFEEAAFRGFSRKTGDCYVYFACAKMLLDCAGIPNLMVERYPVIEHGHFWNLVQIDGEWYHCDATVFKDHADMYFMCTDEEIADKYHDFNAALYPERAKRTKDYYGGDSYDVPEVYPGEGGSYWNDPYEGVYSDY